MHTLLLHYYLFILLFLLSRKKIESTIEVIVCTLTSIHSEDKKYISDPVQSQARIFIMCFALFCIVIEINTVISDTYVGTYLHCTSTDILVTFFYLFLSN